MRMFPISIAAFLCIAAVGRTAEPLNPAETHTVKLGEHNFTLPKGFTIEKVAGSPQVDRPVNGSFDKEGRLYVSDSSGSNDKPTEQLKNPTHRVVRLESSKKDGVFDKSVVFADKLSFLQGTLWYEGSLYVAAPPVILKLTDTDDDGAADKREVWFDGKTLTGCANDLHGPYLGSDDNLRGYRKERFAGKSKFYNQAELRLRLANFKTYLFPAAFGIMAFFDAGRVWKDEDTDKKMFTGYGGGIWFSPLRRLLITLSYAVSKEDKIPLVGLGWKF